MWKFVLLTCTECSFIAFTCLVINYLTAQANDAIGVQGCAVQAFVHNMRYSYYHLHALHAYGAESAGMQ